jgi:hypothetical protein
MATESSLDEREQIRERLSRRARLRVGLAGAGPRSSAAPTFCSGRQLDAGEAEPVALFFGNLWNRL